jgi:hypothetical protein
MKDENYRQIYWVHLAIHFKFHLFIIIDYIYYFTILGYDSFVHNNYYIKTFTIFSYSSHIFRPLT